MPEAVGKEGVWRWNVKYCRNVIYFHKHHQAPPYERTCEDAYTHRRSRYWYACVHTNWSDVLSSALANRNAPALPLLTCGKINMGALSLDVLPCTQFMKTSTRQETQGNAGEAKIKICSSIHESFRFLLCCDRKNTICHFFSPQTDVREIIVLCIKDE